MSADRTRRLSRHYRLGDFLIDPRFPDLAERLEPSERAVKNLERLASVLDRIADKFPSEWRVISGFRDPELNRAWREQGQPASINSLHLSGCAADIEPAEEVDLEEVFEWVRAEARVDFAVHEAVFYPMKGFIHLAVEDRENPTPKRILMRT